MSDISKCETLLFGGGASLSRRRKTTLVKKAAPSADPQAHAAVAKKPRVAVKYVLPPIETTASETAAHALSVMHGVDESVCSAYCSLYNVQRVVDKAAPCPTADDNVLETWNAWAFPFRSKVMYGRLVISGLSMPHTAEILALGTVKEFVEARFVGTDAAPPLTFADVAVYVRSQIKPDVRASVTDAVLLMVLWKLGMHDHIAWASATTLETLPVRARFVESPHVFDKAVSSHPSVPVSAQWLQKLAAVAFTFFEMSNRDDAWRVQFTGMHTMAEAAFAYFGSLRPFIGRQVFDDMCRASTLCSADEQVVPLDMTDAAYAEMRLPLRAYRNDFSWMFVAAYALAHASTDARLSLIRGMVASQNAWSRVMVPRPAVSITTSMRNSTPMLPAYMLDVYTVTSSSHALATLNWLLRDDDRTWVAVRNRAAFYKDLDFDWTRFAPQQMSDFMTRVSHHELHGVFVALDACVEEGNEDAAFVSASTLMHTDINSVFAFVDCEPRRVLRDTLVHELSDCPHVTCTHLHDVSFLSQASTSLWWWLFEQPNVHATLRRTMAYACEIASRYPALAQMALWSAFVRVVGLWTPTSRPAAVMDDADNELPTAGKLTGIAGRSTPLMDAIPEHDVCAYHTMFRTEEAAMRVYVAMCNPIEFATVFSSHSKSTVQQGIIERVFLRGDWNSPLAASVLHGVMFGFKDTHAVSCDHVEATMPFEGFETTIERVVDVTASASVLHASATLACLYPVRLVESLVSKFSGRVQWT